MPNPKKFAFDRDGTQRVVRVVRAYEKAPDEFERGEFAGDDLPPKPIVVVKITAACTGAKKWKGIVQQGGISPDAATWNTTALAMPENFEPPTDKTGAAITEPNCYVVSVSESPLEVDRYYPCVRYGREPNANGTDGLPVFIVLAGGANAKRWGKLSSAFSAGDTMTLTPTDPVGTATGEPSVTVYVKKDKTTHTMSNLTTVATTMVIPFLLAKDNLYYVDGHDPGSVITNFNIDGATFKFQKKTRDTWGTFWGSESDWVDIITGGECEEA